MIETANNQESQGYWNSYYASHDVPVLPSQFAVFTLGEYRAEAVVDIGCGSGRDSLFFARHRVFTVGVDGSKEAITLCQREAKRLDLPNASFICSDVSDENLADTISSLLAEKNITSKVLIYCRFFLHAITEDSEQRLLATVSRLLKECSGWLAVEFRTPRDRSLQKVTPDHYRRFVDPAEFVITARAFGFKPAYFVEGFGLAKYKQDDAYVARIILQLER